jgi:hypothetical protein
MGTMGCACRYPDYRLIFVVFQSLWSSGGFTDAAFTDPCHRHLIGRDLITKSQLSLQPNGCNSVVPVAVLEAHF